MTQADISVLIVEDNPVGASQMINQVKAFTGDITVSTSAERGLIIFRQALKDHRPYQVVISDINLPGMNGKELMREIRHLEEESGYSFRTRIIAISADPPRKHLLEACRVGAGCYIEKPATREKVSNALDSTGLFNPRSRAVQSV